ncbi:GntR family transcriptional regulator [Sphingomonas abietis]|uniref:GntR family transcriptional regulator n=1 Tax=Sphingomonas abietis TaxID=3012344 RepID=A0ABY7NIJ2_9SPHN|nr:GntR family transcriptional regulator [Sphingomonas abietis]WBO21341.1 GntR family transcriptional regulator [Sphingomonas abietis]
MKPAMQTSDAEDAKPVSIYGVEMFAPLDAAGAGLRRLSASAQIYAALREEIASLVRMPGAALSEAEIAAAFGVSRTPVREAILRLADEGLVDVAPQAGTRVARIPLAELPEMVEIRLLLEGAIVRAAVERASAADIAGLDALLAIQTTYAQNDDRANFHRQDEIFHRRLGEIAGKPASWALLDRVKLNLGRFRRLTLPIPGRMMIVVSEHAALVAALRARNSEAAVVALDAHLREILGALGDVREAYPQLFHANGAPR